ncbi:hypothetical protein K488DRAFT_78564 [Vararia minispora EC-137]|uniref:Uncharacterized protein n=1 Tax=Vararia minispora EC-137 TaxID=1314806 RepID=A0ACB8QKS8_9AGAM|nr:hypothetical protein K488DRAFT_78564 [Vararia minispora EC-137]
MPVVPAAAKVLVSGVNGYLCVWVAHTFLEHDYTIRGTARSYDYGFELVEVADTTAVRIDVVAHIASLFHYNATEPSDPIDLVVKSIVSILESIQAHALIVKRIALTTSYADWNDQAVDLVKKKSGVAGGATIYGASKTLAEMAAWKFLEQSVSVSDLVLINPPYLIGGPIQEVHSMVELNTSQKIIFDVLTGKLPDDQYEEIDFSLVYICNVAETHVRVAESPQEGGTRCLVSAGACSPQDILDIANSLEPKPWDGMLHMIAFNTQQFERVHGFKLRTLAGTIADSLKDFRAQGWIQ